MSQPNPYDSPQETTVSTPSDDALESRRFESSGIESTGLVARAIEYLIAILLIIALLFAFVQGII